MVPKSVWGYAITCSQPHTQVEVMVMSVSPSFHPTTPLLLRGQEMATEEDMGAWYAKLLALEGSEPMAHAPSLEKEIATSHRSHGFVDGIA